MIKNNPYYYFLSILVTISMISAMTFNSLQITNGQTNSSIDRNMPSNNTSIKSINTNDKENNTNLSVLSSSTVKLAPTATINFKNIANKSTSFASLSSLGPIKPKDIEESKSRTLITEKQTELSRLQTKNFFSKNGQAGISSLNNRGPGSAGLILINPNIIPQFNMSNKATNNASNINSTLNTKQLIANSMANNTFRTGTSAASISTNKQSVTITNGWLGLNIAQSHSWYPPDVTAAVGPNHIVEMVNHQMSVWFKNGRFDKSADTSEFFQTGKDFISDPKIVFDPLSGHWFASVVDAGKNGNGNNNCLPDGCFVVAAASSTDDPTGKWYTYMLPYGNTLPDQPIIATYSYGLVISVNAYNSICINGCANVLVVGKDAMIVGGSVEIQMTGNLPQEYSLNPAQSLSPTECAYIPSVGHQHTTEVRISAWCGNPSGHNAAWYPNIVRISMQEKFTPISIQQPGGIAADPGDGRIISASYFNKKLWWGFNDECNQNDAKNAHVCVRVQSIDLNDPTKLSVDKYVAMPGVDSFYPALTIDNSGNMIFIFGISSSTLQPSLIVGTSSSTLQPSLIVDDSNWNFKSLITGTSDIKDGKVGDYFASGADPSGQCAIVAGEFGSNIVPNQWSTYIGNVCSQ